MLRNVGSKQPFPIFGIVRHKQEIIAVAEVHLAMDDGIDEAFILLFDLLQLDKYILVPGRVIAVVVFKYLHFVVLLEVLDVRLCHLQPFQAREGLFLLFRSCRSCGLFHKYHSLFSLQFRTFKMRF